MAKYQSTDGAREMTVATAAVELRRHVRGCDGDDTEPRSPAIASNRVNSYTENLASRTAKTHMILIKDTREPRIIKNIEKLELCWRDGPAAFAEDCEFDSQYPRQVSHSHS